MHGMGLGLRIFIFATIFSIGFGAYVMAFVTGGDWGLAYGNWCVGITKFLARYVTQGVRMLPLPDPSAVASGIERMMTSPIVAVAIVAFLVATIVVLLLSLLTWLRSLVRALGGTDGSQAEVYGDSADGRMHGAAAQARPARP